MLHMIFFKIDGSASALVRLVTTIVSLRQYDSVGRCQEAGGTALRE